MTDIDDEDVDDDGDANEQGHGGIVRTLIVTLTIVCIVIGVTSPRGLRIARLPWDYGLRRGLLIARGLPRRDGFRD